MEIRPYTPQDAPAVKQVHDAAMAAMRPGPYTPRQLEVLAGSEITAGDWEGYLRNTHCFVAMEKGQIVGFGDIGIYPYASHINRLFVDGQHQGKGIGTLLIQYLEREAKRKDTQAIGITALIPALDFYIRHGYTDKGRCWLSMEGEDIPIRVLEKSFRQPIPSSYRVRLPRSSLANTMSSVES